MKFLVVMAIEDAKKSEELSEVPAPEILEKIQKDQFEKYDRVSRRFDIAATIIVFLIFLIGVYLTQKFLSPILLSIVLVYLLKPVYDFLFRATTALILLLNNDDVRHYTVCALRTSQCPSFRDI